MTVLPPPSDPSAAPPPQPGPALPGRRLSGAPAWPPWIALLGILCGFAVVVVASIIVGVVAAASGADIKQDLPAGVNIGLTVFQNVALFLTAVLFARQVSRGWPLGSDFGLRRPPSLARSARLLLAVWAGFFALSAAWTVALGLHEKTDLPERLGANLSALNLVVVTLLVTVVAPVGEELFFRGFFFGALRNWRGPWPAAVITGLFFGGVHIGSAPVGQLVPLAIFGFGLSMLYHWNGSLYPCIVLHALNNSLAFGVGEKWTWQIPLVMVAAAVAAIAVAMSVRRALDGVARGGAGRSAAARAG